MAGSIIVSSITLDSDNNFSIKSNTGATLFFANTTGIDVANSIGATAITNDKILSVANTKISGNIISSQISPSVTLTTPIISGNLNLDSAGTTGIQVPTANTISFHTAGTEDVRIDSSGNFLVGATSNPGGLYKVVASGADNNNLIGSYNTATGNAGLRLQANAAGLYLQGSGTVDPLYITNTSATGYISFRPSGDTERMRFSAAGELLITSGVFGYGTGAGGTVTQATSKSTGCTLNKITGQITTNNQSLGAGSSVSFSLNNNTIGSNDLVVLNVYNNSSYTTQVKFVVGGIVNIQLTNVTGGSLSEAVVITFAVIRGAIS